MQNWTYKLLFVFLLLQLRPNITKDNTITVPTPSVGYTNVNFWAVKKSTQRAHIWKHISERTQVSVTLLHVIEIE